MEPELNKNETDRIGENADRIYCRFVRPVLLGRRFETIPHEAFLDLTIAYFLRLRISEEETLSMVIHEEHLERWKMDREELKRLAWQNTLRDCAAVFRPLEEVLAEAGVASAEAGRQLYLLTNEQRSLGAVCIAYPGCLEKIARYIGTDYYVIPSSVHECLILPCDGAVSAGDIRKMIVQINREELEERDVLSDTLYRYSKARSTLMIDNS